MRQQFEEHPEIDPDDPLIVIQAAAETGQVPDLETYLAQFQASPTGIIPIKTPDRLVMIKVQTIVSVEIQANLLCLYTTGETVQTRDTLRHFMQRLPGTTFVQVSKHGLLNLDHLRSLEDSFSGNMTAILANQVKADVSRKYVKNLMQRLGI
ncbi:LytTR family DNA-binding domain-containing protein [Lactiplantibacillus mudanjiangensis]|uniref:Transcriptional regulator [Lactobacillus koreensis] n=1 Tax=Lactiplantibacillus mudanjiangensis TaxID=1296538 RepID=A0A660DYS2_9LACO|nr:LytTR family DNA-binding domain-containing protein [Lactiplantibacillus mudanjiangensis]VDG25434.1 transcriptional regulator [Lactobacillus koreensis] [Lactiplantibacillus mudanjiangensis]VDG28539.1 transcriptional regulator [Lactobacillus koreensis] [Lactiplantibacillus mudanjiangensis]VDG31076.1 transcriptional regulator [Lactobacillus koreensis] [Lactiplantibacillus mudanjiangensis]